MDGLGMDYCLHMKNMGIYNLNIMDFYYYGIENLGQLLKEIEQNERKFSQRES